MKRNAIRRKKCGIGVTKAIRNRRGCRKKHIFSCRQGQNSNSKRKDDMPNVLVTSREVARFEDRYRDVLEDADLHPVYPAPGPANQPTEAEHRAALEGVEAVIAGSEPYTAKLFDEFRRLRVVARVGVGYDSIDVPAATHRGVAVTIAPNTNHGSVAEHAFALMLGLTRHLSVRHEAVRGGAWPLHMSQPLRGRTLGLAGLGRIGKAVALRAAAFEMRILAFELAPDQVFCAANNVTLVKFDHLLAESDFLSLHLPFVPATRHLINRETLARMKPGAVLINTSRGGLVCEADLVEALRNGPLAGAGLDVFEREPPLPDNPLIGLKNVLLTPHAAGVDILSLGDMARSAAQAVASLRRGEWPTEKVINPDVRPLFKW
jgi:D-3-phosphoglycerate dehydrogenase